MLRNEVTASCTSPLHFAGVLAAGAAVISTAAAAAAAAGHGQHGSGFAAAGGAAQALGVWALGSA